MSSSGPCVVADVLPLVRAGVSAALADADLAVVAECSRGIDLPDLVVRHAPRLAIVGAVADLSWPEITSALRATPEPPRTVLMLSRASRATLAELLTLDVDGVFARSIQPARLSELAVRVCNGEHVVDPALLEDEVVDDDVDATALTAREREVLALLSSGQSNREIAAQLFVSLPTVKTHLAHIYAKLGATNRNEALGRAMALGLLGV
jgi:DNA-binding NarL/FixJ family response regulator